MPICENCRSERLDITEDQPQRVYCVDCGSYADGVTPSQVCLACAKEDIESAFEAWGRLEQISRLISLANSRQPECEWAEDAKQRVDARLLRIEADLKQADPSPFVGLRRRFVAMTPDQRLSLLHVLAEGYCRHCGEAERDGRCYCMAED